MTTPPPRIALIHATPLAVDPIGAAFERHWPGARRMNLLDDSLSVDRAEAGELTPAMVERFLTLTRYAVGTGCDGILFTCSAFGSAIERAASIARVPTLKPNEAMLEQALAVPASHGRLRLGLLATFPASLPSMSDELEALAASRAVAIDIRPVYVTGAMDDLAQGHAAAHHRRIADAADALRDCDVVLLAQFSMAGAHEAVQRVLPCPVLTSPDCAVLALKERIVRA